jgi:HEAT repeat protein
MAADSIGAILLSYGEPPTSAWERCGEALTIGAGDGDARVRRSCIYALGALRAPQARASLRKALGDDSAEVRRNAAWSLGQLPGEVDATTLTALRLRLADADALVRRDVAHALMGLAKNAGRARLEEMGEPLFQLARSDRDPVVRKAALAALATLASPAHATHAPQIEGLLESRDAEMRRAAAFALAPVGGRAAERALPVLGTALTDRDPAIQALAAAGLANLGPAAAPLVDDLAKALTNASDATVRRNCAIALGRMKAAAESAVPALAKGLRPRAASASSPPDEQRREDEVRYQIAEALSHVGYPANKAALDAVREAILDDPSPDVRLRCIEALFQLREVEIFEKWQFHKALRKVLAERAAESKLVRYNAARLLAAVYADGAPDEAVEVLLQMIADATIRIFYETTANIEGGTTEAGTGSTGVSARTGGSARFLAAEALGWMSTKSSGNAAVMRALRAASSDAEKKLAETARAVLKKLEE